MPNIYVIAVPKGAGKSTTARALLRRYLTCAEFVNADDIARGLSAFRPESVAVRAARLMLMRLDDLARQRIDLPLRRHGKYTTVRLTGFSCWLGEGVRLVQPFWKRRNGKNLLEDNMTQEAREQLLKKIDAGVKAGVAEALEEHYRMGRSIVVWRDGRVVMLQPEEHKDAIASNRKPPL